MEASPLARSLGTKYPILQAPMTGVSDVPEFCRAVAGHGAVPFLALDLMRRVEVEQLIEESEKVDNDEASLGSSVAMGKELAQAQRLQDKVKQALKSLEQSGRDKLNLSDPDSALMKSRQGSHASYNVQSVVDDRHGLIVHAEAVSETSDVNQFAKQIDQANQLKAAGMPTKEAVIRACRNRLRPILMTSFAFIFGVSPLIFATGAGAVARQTIGWTVLEGMLAATLLGIFIVPVLFTVIIRYAYGEHKLEKLQKNPKSIP